MVFRFPGRFETIWVLASRNSVFLFLENLKKLKLEQLVVSKGKFKDIGKKTNTDDKLAEAELKVESTAKEAVLFQSMAAAEKKRADGAQERLRGEKLLVDAVEAVRPQQRQRVQQRVRAQVVVGQ